MILPFSTKLKGNKTYFPEKILTGLISNNLITHDDFIGGVITEKNPLVRLLTINAGNNIVNVQCIQKYIFDFTISHKPKIHTIREDKKGLWKPGRKIDFFINCRQPNMFRFAPVLSVVSVQEIEIFYFPLTTIPVRKVPVLKVDGEIIYDAAGINEKQMLEFANNDGFDSIEDFFNYFNENFKGKLIHWTDLKY